MQTGILRGRDFNEHDDLSAPKAMIIGEATAKQFFGSAEPLGKTIGLDKQEKPDEKDFYQVIGVVKDAKYFRMNEDPTKTIYLASGQDEEPAPHIGYEIRTDSPVEALIPSIRAAVGEQNQDISLEFRSFEVLVSESLIQPRVVALLSLIFGSLALLLAIVGLYGVTSYAVTRRQAEIGIRIAMGAPRSAMIWMVLRDVLMLLAVGISLGLAMSFAGARLVTTLLFGVKANDPVQLAGAAIILAAATVIAAYLPARYAAKVDPMVALRYE
jgi:putative ABC transport system permease protein